MGTRQAVAALVAASVAALASCSTLESTPHADAAGASMAQPEAGSQRGGQGRADAAARFADDLRMFQRLSSP